MKLHEKLSIILRVVSCQSLIDVQQYGELVEEASLLIARCYPWAMVNHTLHGLLHHSAELIQLNNGYGLGLLSEEGLEATNKHIRRYLELLSRKTCPIQQLTDVMHRLLERSNPMIIHRKEMMNKKCKELVCLECGSHHHSTRGHDNAQNKKTEYDILVDRIIL